MTDSADIRHMDSALALAARAIGVCEPNPRVGCVLVGADGLEIGAGSTQQAGGPHAEIMALRDAQSRGHSSAGATAYVTLEPCSHHGRTAPCCDALAREGVRRVVAALVDPNPKVAGNGIARLRAAGVEVQVGPAADAARELNIGFFSRMLRQRPWTRMKIAASLDGVTALENGQSQWITSEAARVDGHAWRARASAVLTGIGTVLEDDPSLDVRLVAVQHQPALVVVDSQLQLPLQARLFSARRVLLVYAAQNDPQKAAALQTRGARVALLPGATAAGRLKVDLTRMLSDLALRHEVNELHVEAGHKLNGSLLRAGLVDELLVYLAPKLIGPGRVMAALDPLACLADVRPLQFRSVAMVGPDLRLLARTVQEPWF
ncbi:MAG: bifunctional diaminohydroxyphosphoribosylaminopyrimidine deaminase/5-amino-6-(5-phosphoribosylamino)uracil reductase RibD [Rhodoferax sp.]|nr:bifunctional diaminohydroxyphosphoribosylaminopyrimidine deaminase/5-amino-6-(5-phosphoribosylamino)uracil reductase RibD [Rhodoferax sp.]